ncbi:MAG: efflux RND transporter permease subunit [Nannocystaceae bacterium]|nr:efflux RND transporter permease subunit [Nannocystaceae bacterium]
MRSNYSLSDLALSRPVSVGMALATVVLLGVIGLFEMPLAFLPTRAATQISVRVRINRTSPEVLEREVVRPLENAVAGVRGLQRIQVGSGSWGARMKLDFEPGADPDASKLEVRERIERARPNLPDLVRSIEISSHGLHDDPVMEMRIASGTDLTGDYYLVEERIVRRLERVPGVSRVELQGVKPHELEVAVDIEAASRSGVSVGEVGTVVRDAQRGRSLGLLRAPRTDVGVRTTAVPADPKAFADLPLPRTVPVVDGASATGPPQASIARLGDVAEVSLHPEENRDGKTLNGRSAINIEVYASAGASTVEVTRRVAEETIRIGQDPALDGIELLVFESQGDTILQTLGDLRDTGIYGGVLGVLVLFLFLHRFTTTFAASVSIPLSVCAASAFMYLQGGELNCIVLLGLVLSVGMLIDNAVVIVESIARHARRGLSPMEAARVGAREVSFATIASTLSTVIVFIPLLMSDPTTRMGAYLQPLGLTLAVAMTASLLVSQTAVPLLMGKILRPKPKVTRHGLLEKISRGYAWLIARTLRTPRLAVLVGFGLAATAYIPGEPLVANMTLDDPDRQDDHMPIRFEFAGSRGFERIGDYVKVAETELLAHRDEVGLANVSCGWSDHWANCRAYPSMQFESETEYEQFKTRLLEALPDQAGVRYRLGERRFSWNENRDRNVVQFALRGEDMQELLNLSKRVAAHLSAALHRGTPTEHNPSDYDQITTPYEEGAVELHARLQGDRLQRLGLTADDVARRVSFAFQGTPLGTVPGERGEITLRLSAINGDETGAEAGRAALRDLKIPTADGQSVPLSSVADVELVKRPWWVQRVDRSTEVKLSVRFFEADGKANWGLVSDAMASFTFPEGYSWGRGTRWRQQKKAGNEMLINLGLCLLLVYAVMASLFESFLQPFGILLTCLLGCFGAPWGLWLTDTTVDTTAIVGFFILIGIVVNNGIMLVDKVRQLRASGMARDEALAEAGRHRLRPILMTMTTTILGLVPMLIHHPTLAGVYYHSIAIVIAGGLTTGTIVTLVFLPAAYATLEDFSLTATSVWRKLAPGKQR